MIELWLNGTKMVLDGRTVITQTRQNNDLSKGIAGRQISYTNQFKIPAEPNRTFFDELGLTGNTSIKPYRITTARLVVDGIELYNNGKCRIVKTIEDYYDAQILFDADILDTLKRLRLQDIDKALLWPAGTDAYTLDSYFDYRRVWQNRDDYAWTFPYRDGASDTLDSMVPFWKEKDLIVAILEGLGVPYNAPFLTTSDIEDYVFSPKTGGEVTDQVTAVPFSLELDETDLDYNQDVYAGSGSSEDYETLIAFSWSGEFTGTSLRIELETSFGGTLYDSGVLSAGVIGDTHDVADWPRNQEITLKITGVGVTDFSIQFEYNARRVTRTFSLNSLLPEWLQIDLLREVAMRYNLNIYEIDGVYEFKSMADILSDRANAQDWSDIFQGVIEEIYDTSYAQLNRATFTNSEEIGQDDNLELDNEHLTRQSDIFNSKYRYSQGEQLLYATQGDADTWIRPLEWVDDREVTLHKITWDITSYPNLTFGEQGPSYTYTGAAGTEVGQVYGANGEPTGARWANVFAANYEELRQTLERYKEMKVRIRLNPIDFKDIRMDRLVFIRQLGAYFYINKVADYRDGFANAYLLQLPTSFV